MGTHRKATIMMNWAIYKLLHQRTWANSVLVMWFDSLWQLLLVKASVTDHQFEFLENFGWNLSKFQHGIIIFKMTHIHIQHSYQIQSFGHSILKCEHFIVFWSQQCNRSPLSPYEKEPIVSLTIQIYAQFHYESIYVYIFFFKYADLSVVCDLYRSKCVAYYECCPSIYTLAYMVSLCNFGFVANPIYMW